MENEIMNTEKNEVVEAYEVEEENSKGISAPAVIGIGAAIIGGVVVAKKVVAPKVKKWRRNRAEKILAKYDEEAEDDFDDEYYDADYEEVEEEE